MAARAPLSGRPLGIRDSPSRVGTAFLPVAVTSLVPLVGSCDLVLDPHLLPLDSAGRELVHFPENQIIIYY